MNNNTCESCIYFLRDYSTGTSECARYDDMTEEETIKHYTNDEPGCPCFKSESTRDYEYMTALSALLKKGGKLPTFRV